MPLLQHTILDTGNAEEIERFERTLYRVFGDDEPEVRRLIREYDHKNRRMRFKIPYASCEIYAAKIGRRIVSGVAMNYNMRDRLEIEMLGFTVDKSEPGICEGFALFNTQMFFGRTLVANEFRKFVMEKLRARNVSKCYATCSAARLRGYRFLGWNDIDSREINGTTKYLLMQTLPAG
jgi:hypothetical protein